MTWRRVQESAGVGLVLGVLWVVQFRILTYVTGQDPFTYTRLAMDIVKAGFGLESIREVASFIMPGYPLLLAAVILVAGPLAVAWVNVVLLSIIFLLLFRLVRRWDMGGWAFSIIGLCLIWLIFRHGPLNPHFLFYAFRGPAQLLCIVAAFSLVVDSGPGLWSGRLRLSAACGLLLIGALIRETALLAWPALAAWMLGSAEWRRHRLQGIGWLAAPLVAAGAGVGLLFLGMGWDPHTQAGLWLRALLDGGMAGFQFRLQSYLHILFVLEWGWIGTGLFIAGLWGLRRRWNALLLWIVPAVLWILFYSGYGIHRRFLLDSLFLLSVVSAIGAWYVIDGIGRLFPAHVRKAIPVVAAVLMLFLNAQVIAHMVMWGPRIHRADIRRFVETVRVHADDDRRIYGEGRCPYLVETLMVYARTNPGDLWDRIDELTAETTLLYLQPTSRDHWRGGGMATAPQVLHQADLVPLYKDDGTVVRVDLADLTYELFHVRAWHQVRVKERIGDAAADGLFWLDFQSSDPEATRTISVRDAVGAVVASWTVADGNGLIPFALPDTAEDAGTLTVVVESTSPLPASLVTRPNAAHDPNGFTLVDERFPSVLEWLGDSIHISRPHDKWGAVFTDTADFEIPLPRGLSEGAYFVTFVLEPRPPNRQQTVRFEYRTGDPAATVYTDDLDQYRLWQEVRADAPFRSSTWPIALSVEGLPEGHHFRIVHISGRVVFP